MAPSTQSVFDAALALPEEERVELADRLWASLDSSYYEKVDAAWLEEIERRVKDFDEGRSTAIPAEEVFRAIRARRRS